MLRARWLAGLAFLTTSLFVLCGAADDRHPLPHPTLPWVALQLIPSPGVVVAKGEASFAAQWAVAPVLYSFGIHRSLSPWRFFVVEPVVRHSGSLELRGGVDYLAIPERFGDRFGTRVGLRSYWPLLEKGESLSWSLGSSVGRFDGRTTASYDLGLHTLLGILGAVVELTPTPDGARCTILMEVRVL